MAICIVTGTICKADGTVLEGVAVVGTIKSTLEDQGGQVADSCGVSSEAIEATTQSDGTFSIDLIQGSTVLLEIDSINLRKEILVPALATADFTTLI